MRSAKPGNHLKPNRGLERHSICFSRGIVETFGTPCGQEPTGMRPFNPKWSRGPLFETRTQGKRYSPFKIGVSTNFYRKLRSITDQKVPYFFEITNRRLRKPSFMGETWTMASLARRLSTSAYVTWAFSWEGFVTSGQNWTSSQSNGIL